MATEIKRMLDSAGLAANISQIAAREYGSTLDTERPVMGTTTGGAKYLGTEDLVSIITAAPAPLTLLRRSRVLCLCDVNAAGGNISLDISAGAEVAGYTIKVFVSGPTTRQAIITYGIGLIEYIPSGQSQEFIWDGAAWNKTLISWADRYNIGSLIESAIDEIAGPKNPIIKLWDSDHILDVANYPLLVPLLRAEKLKAWSGAAYITDHSVTVAGSVITGSGTAWDTLLAALVEDVAVHGGYTAWRSANINGTDFVITNVNTGGHTITVTGSPSTGAQTCIIYARRIAGSTTTCRTYKDSGRASMSPDGVLRMAGLRRRFHMQGHYHSPLSPTYLLRIGSGGYGIAGTGNTAINDLSTGSPIADPTNGTPITGPETEPNSSTIYRTMWAGVQI